MLQRPRLGGTHLDAPFSPLRVPGPGPRPLSQLSALPPDMISLPDELSNAWPIPGSVLADPVTSLPARPAAPLQAPSRAHAAALCQTPTSAHPRAFHSFADPPEVGMGDNGSACHAHSHPKAVTAFPRGALSPKPALGGGHAHSSTSLTAW